VEVAAALECAPGAIAAAKALCREVSRGTAADQMQLTAERLADRWETDEVREGITAFLAKKKPWWRA
jgi:methylglutaconyl-CoA hydratase